MAIEERGMRICEVNEKKHPPALAHRTTQVSIKKKANQAQMLAMQWTGRERAGVRPKVFGDLAQWIFDLRIHPLMRSSE
jgi:hypothetical protein